MTRKYLERVGAQNFETLVQPRAGTFYHSDDGHSDIHHGDHSDANLPFHDSHGDHDDWKADVQFASQPSERLSISRVLLELEQRIARLESKVP